MQPPEGSHEDTNQAALLRIHLGGDPSFRLKSGSTQDDAERSGDLN